MTTDYSGSCACGAVSVRIEGEPAGPYQCFCKQCQRASGGGPATFVMAAKDKVTIEGDVASFGEGTESGNSASRSFCPKCGTAVYSEPAKSPGAIMVKLSMIENAPWNAVKAAFWTSEKPAWFPLSAETKQYETQP